MAGEYDAAQERGEVRSNGERSFSQAEKVGISDLGLTGKAIHEARQLRDAEAAAPGIVRWRTRWTLRAPPSAASRTNTTPPRNGER